MYHFGHRSRNVEYWRGDGTLHVRRVATDEWPLASIQQWSDFAAQQTLLPPAGLIAMALAGVEPGHRVTLDGGRSVVLPGLEVITRRRLPAGDQVVIELDVRKLTDRNLRLLRQRAASAFGSARRSTSKQERVIEVVQQLGGPPSKRFDQAFWKRVAKRLKIDEHRAAARLYYRATKGRPSR